MRATARRAGSRFLTSIEIRDHQVLVDEPPDHGGNDEGPTPQELLAASLASCVAITLQMYAERKGWDIGGVEVRAEYDTPERGQPTSFRVDVALPPTCSAEQVERLRVIAGRCPVHRILEGDVRFEEHVHPIDSAAE